MRIEKAAISEETLQRLWSEIALLRQKIAKAERDRAASKIDMAAAIVGAQTRIQSRSGRSL